MSRGVVLQRRMDDPLSKIVPFNAAGFLKRYFIHVITAVYWLKIIAKLYRKQDVKNCSKWILITIFDWSWNLEWKIYLFGRVCSDFIDIFLPFQVFLSIWVSSWKVKILDFIRVNVIFVPLKRGCKYFLTIIFICSKISSCILWDKLGLRSNWTGGKFFIWIGREEVIKINEERWG